MGRRSIHLVAAFFVITLVVSGCTQAPPPPPAPTPAPAAPTKAAEPTKPAAPTKAAEPTKPAVPTKAPEATKAPTAAAKEADYPTKGKAITLIVPWPAGGAVDIGARIVAPAMEKELGTSIALVNKAGASSQVGLTELSLAKPDGYTLAVTNLPTTAVTYLDPELKASYNRASFQPVAAYNFDPFVIGVSSESPYKDLKGLVDAAKANPEKLKSSTTGLMSLSHIAALLLQEAAGVKFTRVHFEGGPQATTALLGGHVDITVVSGSNMIAHVKSGRARVIGVMDAEESKFFPGVKTAEAQGYKASLGTTSAVSGPANMPAPIVDTLARAMGKALEQGDVKQKMEEMTYVVRYMNTARLTSYWAEMDDYAKRLLPLVRQ